MTENQNNIFTSGPILLSQNVFYHMTRLETKLDLILTYEAMCFCSRAAWLFPTPIVLMCTILIQVNVFCKRFCKEHVQGAITGRMINGMMNS